MEPERNNTNFPLYTYERLKSKKHTQNDLEMYHQFLVRQFVLDNPKIRGILAFHAMGTGKTRLGALNIKEFMASRQIVVIAPTSVFPKFAQEFEKVGVNTNDVKFISLRASNLGAQIDRLEGKYDADDPLDILRKTPLDNTFLFVDEAHNLFNSIVNGSKNAVDLYDNIMSARNLKLMFLTGSPISNVPFELVPCFNMLAGHKLFPENQEDFDKYFITEDGLHVKNAEKFKNRIFGLVSYFGDWIQATVRADRPTRLPTKVIKVPMSDEQYAIYSGFRDKEREESAGKRFKRNTAERFAPKTSSSSYRIKSRQASNIIPVIAKNKGVDNEKNCPKFYKAEEIIMSHNNQPGMFYSNFVNSAGLLDFTKLLEEHGWEEWDGETTTKNKKRFAIISGDISTEERNKIQTVASSDGNMHGEIIRLVLVGPAGAEGIEFHNFRYVIQLDPFFNAVRGDQVENRIDRYKSHIKLPIKERTVQTYYLLADYPKNLKNIKETKELTTDEHLYIQSKRRKLLSLEFYRLLIEASPDCPVHRDLLPAKRASKIHCLLCAPTNDPLFTDNVHKDIKAVNPCKAPQVETLKAKEILIDSDDGQKKFMYTKTADDTIEFFEYRDDLGGYLPVVRNHPEYDLLMDAVTSKPSKPIKPAKSNIKKVKD